jgi:hypothetical protein
MDESISSSDGSSRKRPRGAVEDSPSPSRSSSPREVDHIEALRASGRKYAVVKTCELSYLIERELKSEWRGQALTISQPVFFCSVLR